MHKPSKKTILVTIALIGMTPILAGCALFGNKATQQFNDAKRGVDISGPAQVGNMPDGFSNWAEKCDGHGFRVFTLFHHNSPYGGIAAVPDPTCKSK